MSLSELKAVKARLGGLAFLDFTSSDLESAHKNLGQNVKDQVYKILHNKFEHQNPELLAEQIRQVRRCRSILTARAGLAKADPAIRPVKRPLIRAGLDDYLRCLAAWAEGAELDDFSHPNLSRFRVDGKAVKGLDLAWLLQHDNTGCQTGLYRRADGSVILWHTEEDGEEEGDRFDKLRLFSFQINDEASKRVTVHALIYPDLLPGPAFGWRSDGFIQAVDALLVKQSQPKGGGVLANIASWMTLRLGPRVEPEEVLKAMQPFYDGLAINTVSRTDGRIYPGKCEFFNNTILPCGLAEAPGSYLFQVNVFAQSREAELLNMESIPAEYRQVFVDRAYRTRRMLNKLRKDSPGQKIELEDFFKLITSRAGGDWGYANPDVKAYFLAKVSVQGTEIWLGNGPPLSEDEPLKLDVRA